MMAEAIGGMVKGWLTVLLRNTRGGLSAAQRQPDHDDKGKGHQRRHRAYSRAFWGVRTLCPEIIALRLCAVCQRVARVI